MRNLYWIGLFIMSLVQGAFALSVNIPGIPPGDQILLGEPVYNGTGCPIQSVGVVLSPDSTQLSVLFNAFNAVAKGNHTTDRKTCNLGIPVHVPQGLSLSVFQVDYRGYNSLPQGASSQLTSEYFFANRRGPRADRLFFGEMDEDFYVQDLVPAGALVWSACGADTNLRINASIRAKTNIYGEETQASVDSVDISNGMIYHLQWKRCF